MKKYVGCLFIILLLFIVSACSKPEDIKLTKADVMITENKDLVGSTTTTIGKHKNQTIVPTALYYTFTVKNNSNKPIFRSQLNKVKMRIEPDQDLLSVVEDTIGSNIYNVNKSKIGWGQGVEEIAAKGTGKFNLYYNLGAKQKSDELPLVPTKEELQNIKGLALKATLIVLKDGKEIARFKLDRINK
ncbi:hypothetical protein [Priestia megaterium]|uniref:hypothetical protein n=1 Tax=Priestia megaterium TaxID=1404 RepID=UPI002E213850|nr:hypothetical protein [Priestia megaterium]